MADWRQQTLGGINRGNNSNKGKEFEKALDQMHDFYRNQGLIDVSKNVEQWGFTSVTAQNFKWKWENAPGTAARCNNHLGLVRFTSEPDYSGGNGSISVMFDAKQTNGKSISLANLETHQIGRLKQAAKCGVITGFLIWFYEEGRCFFAPVAFVLKKEEIWLKQSGKRAAKGTASISIAELEINGREVFQHKYGYWDWFSAVCQPELFTK